MCVCLYVLKDHGNDKHKIQDSSYGGRARGMSKQGDGIEGEDEGKNKFSVMLQFLGWVMVLRVFTTSAYK